MLEDKIKATDWDGNERGHRRASGQGELLAVAEGQRDAKSGKFTRDLLSGCLAIVISTRVFSTKAIGQ